jgi:hypothetical protein
MYIAKLKDGPKRVKKTLNDLRKGFWNCMMEGEKMKSHQKGFFKLKCFSPLKILTSPSFYETLGAFLSLPLFFFLCSVSWGLGGFVDIWEGNHFFKNFFSNSFNILAVDTYSGMELCTPIWLNRDEGLMDILVVDTYSVVELCTPIFLGEASK